MTSQSYELSFGLSITLVFLGIVLTVFVVRIIYFLLKFIFRLVVSLMRGSSSSEKQSVNPNSEGDESAVCDDSDPNLASDTQPVAASDRESSNIVEKHTTKASKRKGRKI